MKRPAARRRRIDLWIAYANSVVEEWPMSQPAGGIIQDYQSIDGSPPSPWARVRVRRPDGTATDFACEWGLLDTGSTWTYVPDFYEQDLHLIADGTQPVRFADGTEKRVRACVANIALEGRELPRSIRVLLTPLTRVIVGRDVLDNFSVTFDGVAKKVGIHISPTRA
jgi:hypothetical protein